jgi:hypothetical protein
LTSLSCLQRTYHYECVKIKCNDFSLHVSAIYWVVDVGKRAYCLLFVEDIEAITDNSGLRHVILIIGDFNLPKVKWKFDEESGSMIPLNVTSDLECVTKRSNENGTFMDMVLMNVPGGAKTLLLKLDRHHKAYEIEIQVCCCTFEAYIEGGVKHYRFKLAAIAEELDAVDWCSLFRREGSKNAWTSSPIFKEHCALPCCCALSFSTVICSVEVSIRRINSFS